MTDSYSNPLEKSASGRSPGTAVCQKPGCNAELVSCVRAIGMPMLPLRAYRPEIDVPPPPDISDSSTNGPPTASVLLRAGDVPAAVAIVIRLTRYGETRRASGGWRRGSEVSMFRDTR